MGSARRFLLVLVLLAVDGGVLSACSNHPQDTPPSLSTALSDANVVPVSAGINHASNSSFPRQPEQWIPANPETATLNISEELNPARLTNTKVENPDLTALQSFSDEVSNGEAGVVRGVYAANVFTLRVLQQPAGDPAFVSSIEGTVTQFSQADQMNVIGLLAHNFASGRFFFNLTSAALIHVIYGDGTTKEYVVTSIYRYQTLQPNNPSSNFVDLDTGESLSASQVFMKVYSGEHHLTLQTCIEQDGIASWGRLFVVAQALNGTPTASVQ